MAYHLIPLPVSLFLIGTYMVARNLAPAAITAIRSSRARASILARLPGKVTKYQKRCTLRSFLDRIDINIEVCRVEYEKLSDQRMGEPSEKVRRRVEAAREIQCRRFAASTIQNNLQKFN